MRTNKKIKLKFHEPIYYANNVYEIFPNMNLPRLPKDEYMMQLYYNLVKGLARDKSKKINLKKEGFKVSFYYGLNSKDVYVRDKKIFLTNKIKYPVLNEILAYIVTQLLYENIEKKPFTLELNLEQEKQLKQVKYYLKNCYFNTWHIVREYLLCNRNKISERFKKIGFNNLREVEEKIKEL